MSNIIKLHKSVQYEIDINGMRYDPFVSDVDMYRTSADLNKLMCDAASSAFGPGCIAVSDPLGMKKVVASIYIEMPRVYCTCYVLSKDLKVLSGEIQIDVYPVKPFSK